MRREVSEINADKGTCSLLIQEYRIEGVCQVISVFPSAHSHLKDISATAYPAAVKPL